MPTIADYPRRVQTNLSSNSPGRCSLIHSLALIYEKSLAPIETFTASQAARLSGLTPTMLDYLCREKFVRPSASASRGRGRARQFNFDDLVMLKVIARLLRCGVEVRRLARGLRGMRGRLGSASAVGIKYLVTNGQEVFLRENGTLESLAEQGQLAFAFLIDLDICERELNEARQREQLLA